MNQGSSGAAKQDRPPIGTPVGAPEVRQEIRLHGDMCGCYGFRTALYQAHRASGFHPSEVFVFGCKLFGRSY